MNRDGNLHSLWQDTTPPATFNSMNKGKYDVIIIGGGITGLTAALLLQEAGKKCVVAEAKNIGFGTTGGTTAHLNTLFDSPYNEVIKNFSKDAAILYSNAGVEAIALVESLAAKYNIDCSFERKTAYLFATEEKQVKDLEDIVEATKEVGLAIDYINDSPFPVPYLKIASLGGHAQFHPGNYLLGLAKAFINLGGEIIENCRVTGLKESEEIEVETSIGVIPATHAFYATHIPPGVNLLHFRCAPYRSYVIACTLTNGKYPDDLGYDLEDPYHYYRTQEINGKKYLIAGGEDHKTGHNDNTDQCFRNLESYVRKYFEVDEIVNKWSSQYFDSNDGLPYIGELPGTTSNVYVATGFIGNGMTLGSLSGKIISDLITTGNSKYKELFRPSRIKPVAGFESFVTEAADVVAHFIGDKINVEKITSLNELAPGEARVIKYDGHTIAAYKDENHKVYAVNSACTHIKCNVGWNSSEKTWDCPCHGSRFSYEGEMLTAPARRDLEKINIKG